MKIIRVKGRQGGTADPKELPALIYTKERGHRSRFIPWENLSYESRSFYRKKYRKNYSCSHPHCATITLNKYCSYRCNVNHKKILKYQDKK